jgi:hypothetical protein
MTAKRVDSPRYKAIVRTDCYFCQQPGTHSSQHDLAKEYLRPGGPSSGGALAIAAFGTGLVRKYTLPLESFAFLHITNLHEHSSLSADLWPDAYVPARAFSRHVWEVLDGAVYGRVNSSAAADAAYAARRSAASRRSKRPAAHDNQHALNGTTSESERAHRDRNLLRPRSGGFGG